MRRIIYLWVAFALPLLAFGQTITGELSITVTEAGEAIEYANVGVFFEGALVKTGSTDSTGYLKIRGLSPGKYNIRVSYFGKEKLIENTVVEQDKTTPVDVFFDQLIIKGVVVTGAPKGFDPIVDIPLPISTTSPLRNNINGMINTAPGVFSLDGSTPVIGGSRPGSQNVYWNGVSVSGGRLSNFPSAALQNVSIMLGGFSAEYGDFLGGAITINTPRPGLRKHRSVEFISSSLFDKYHNNYGELFFMGPLIIKNKGRDSAKVKLGYMLSSNFQYQADRSPSAVGVWRVKPDKLKELEENPLRSSPVGKGFVPSAEFITQSDLEKVSANQNVPSTSSSVLGELNFVPNDNMQILVGAKYDYNNAINYNYGNNLFNSGNNSQSISHNLLTYINFNQTLKIADGSKITNASYNVRLDYQGNWAVQQDPVHGSNLFDYGYIGQYKTYSKPSFEFRENGENGQADTFTVNGQTYYLKNYYRQTGNRPTDTLVTFDRTNTRNPLRANYTSQYYDLAGQENIHSITDIRSSSAGLLNGQNPIGVYSNMWNNTGFGVQGYGKSENLQMGINATGQLSTKTHDVRFGVYYEQRVQRSWSVTANSLWTLMGQLANNGITLDTENPHLSMDNNGVFNDTVRFDYTQSENQSTFDKRLRAALIEKGAVDNYGKPIGPNSIIDVNSLNPGDFSLSMFSADELLNNGNSYVNYFGYDYTGNKARGNSSTGSFTNDVLNRPVSAYMPSYAAAFVQDKIQFKNFVLRAGVRLERFDNNMPVLKDPFLLYSAHTAAEVKSVDGKDVVHPSSIGNNYVVYVDDAGNPTQITGYRNGNTWYNAKGLQVADPAVIAEKSKGGTIQPYLLKPNQNKVEASAFTDFKPQVQLLPRLYFDFPLPNNAARFFASYDVLAQRPTNNLATIAQYYYLPYNSTDIIGNPDLKPQRSTNFEMGFRMRLSNKSVLGLTASYREQRNLIQLYRYNYAFPVSYTSFANIDFATIKSFTAQYTLRENNVEMDASYTLQFADGTGSGAGSQQALVAVGQPNLRTLFPLSFDVRNNIKFNVSYATNTGKNYKGPVIKGVRIFENVGMAVNLNAFSGLPYTTNQLPTPEAQSGISSRSPIKGTPFGARLPWQFQNDLSIYKNVPVSFGKGPKNKNSSLRFTLYVNNALNIKNIRAIHSYTGSSSNDGWLASAQGQKAIESAVSAQSFVDLYNTALANPGFYTMPRRIRLGVTLTF
jgi:hypothetical protein